MTLICLVGGQPLPNYLAWQRLKPDRLVLVCTKATEEEAKHQYRVFLQGGGKQAIIKQTSPYLLKALSENASKLAEELQLGPDDILNYTAGTKPMALGFYLGMMDKGVRLLYVDTENHVFRWQTSKAEEKEPISLNIDFEEVAGLRGFSIREETFIDEKDNPLIKLANHIGENLSDAELSELRDAVINHRNEKISFDFASKSGLIVKGGHSEELNIKVQEKSYSVGNQENPWQFFEGGWFEYWVGRQASKVLEEVTINMILERAEEEDGKAANEIDVMGIHKSIPIFFECKTSKSFSSPDDEIRKLNAIARLYGGRYSVKILCHLYPVTNSRIIDMEKSGVYLLIGRNQIRDWIKELPALIEQQIPRLD